MNNEEASVLHDPMTNDLAGCKKGNGVFYGAVSYLLEGTAAQCKDANRGSDQIGANTIYRKIPQHGSTGRKTQNMGSLLLTIPAANIDLTAKRNRRW